MVRGDKTPVSSSGRHQGGACSTCSLLLSVCRCSTALCQGQAHRRSVCQRALCAAQTRQPPPSQSSVVMCLPYYRCVSQSKRAAVCGLRYGSSSLRMDLSEALPNCAVPTVPPHVESGSSSNGVPQLMPWMCGRPGGCSARQRSWHADRRVIGP